LNPSGREQLLQLVQDLAGQTESTSDTSPVERREPKKASTVPPPQKKKVRIWERDILKDIPQVALFSQKSTKERGEDTETSMRLSIATGVVARGLRSGIVSADILASLIDAWEDLDALRGLFQDDAGGGANAPAPGPSQPGVDASASAPVPAPRVSFPVSHDAGASSVVVTHKAVGDAMSRTAKDFSTHQQRLGNEQKNQGILVKPLQPVLKRPGRKRSRTNVKDGEPIKSWGSICDDEDDEEKDDSKESPKPKKGKDDDQKGDV
jgi:hypothetical protein